LGLQATKLTSPVRAIAEAAKEIFIPRLRP
jgi:hypothetical protein